MTKLVPVLSATMALSVWPLVPMTITQMEWSANSAMISVLVDALDRETLLAREDAMRVTLSPLTRVMHRCVVCPMVCPCVWCTSAGLRPHAHM